MVQLILPVTEITLCFVGSLVLVLSVGGDVKMAGALT